MTDVPEELETDDVLQTLGMMYAEMYQTRVELQKLNQTLSEPQSESETVECTQCNATVDISEQQSHLEQEHNAPQSIDPSSFFE